jgi:hypothetical protein
MPTTTGGGNIHFLAERQSDVTNNPNELGELNTLGRQVEAEARTIVARNDCPPALRAALLTGAQQGDQSALGVIQSSGDYTDSVVTDFQDHFRHFLALGTRINGPHQAGLQVERAYYREQGIQSSR